MTITEFLKATGFKPYGSVVNSWDSFNEAGSALMQLWQAPGQRVRNHALPGAYLRVCCFNAEHRSAEGQNQQVGYAGRLRAIAAVEAGARGFAALSSPPNDKRGSGVWAKYADLTRVYPILSIERQRESEDVFVVLGSPVATTAMK
jgi:hypothetical protein